MGPRGLVLCRKQPRAYHYWDERQGIGQAGTLIMRPDRSVVCNEDDAEHCYRRPRRARLLEPMRAL